MRPIRLLTGVLTVGVWTLLSRVLGLVREIIILALIGPGPVMDAFVAAFRLPNMFRRFFAEGAFNAAFVPMFSKSSRRTTTRSASAREALNGLAFVLLVLTGLSLVFMPALVWATAEGFAGDDRFDMTVGLRAHHLSLHLLHLDRGAALGRAERHRPFRRRRRGAGPAEHLRHRRHDRGGVPRRAGRHGPRLDHPAGRDRAAGSRLDRRRTRGDLACGPARPRWSPEMKHLMRVAVPAALAGGVMQINLLVGQQVASNFDKAVGWLYAADRLYQLPLGVVGIAVGIVLLPDLSRRLKADDDEGGKAAFSRAGEISLALTLPSAVALVVIPLPVVSVLFQRGATLPRTRRRSPSPSRSTGSACPLSCCRRCCSRCSLRARTRRPRSATPSCR